MKTVTEKTTHAAKIAEKVEKIEAGHPKEWDRYIASRQKQVKTQSKGKS